MTILDDIVAKKKKELEFVTGVITVRDLEQSALFKREIIPLSEYLLDNSKTGIIAEFKRKSPSRGVINLSASVVDVASGYFREGASGISILTETQFFGGSTSDLLNARKNSLFPILRKDFIIDEYQVIESKAIGADAILLIAAALENHVILNLAQLARSVGLEVLLEIHNIDELDKLNQYINIIGVNNRNLKTFEVNTNISHEIAKEIPAGYVRISESGISSPQIIKNLRSSGYNGFLLCQKL